MNNTHIQMFKPHNDPLNIISGCQEETYPIGPFYQQMKTRSQRNESYQEFLNLQKNQDIYKQCHSSVNEFFQQKQRNNSFQNLIQKLESQQNFRSSLDSMEKFTNQRQFTSVQQKIKASFILTLKFINQNSQAEYY